MKNMEQQIEETAIVITERELAVIKVIDALNEKDAEVDDLNEKLNSEIAKGKKLQE